MLWLLVMVVCNNSQRQSESGGTGGGAMTRGWHTEAHKHTIETCTCTLFWNHMHHSLTNSAKSKPLFSFISFKGNPVSTQTSGTQYRILVLKNLVYKKIMLNGTGNPTHMSVRHPGF